LLFEALAGQPEVARFRKSDAKHAPWSRSLDSGEQGLRLALYYLCLQYDPVVIAHFYVPKGAQKLQQVVGVWAGKSIRERSIFNQAYLFINRGARMIHPAPSCAQPPPTGSKALRRRMPNATRVL
jgi:hypothetical protein